MTKVVYLYRKTHNKTGLKYLGITKRDPFIYRGSGKYWVDHIEKHGDDITTEIIHECTEENVEYWGLYYSDIFDIVESKEYANLKPESGYGGTGMKGKKQSDETKNKISKSNKGKIRTEEQRRIISESHMGLEPWNKGITGYTIFSEEEKAKRSAMYSGQGNPFFGKEHSDEFKELQRQRQKTNIECPHCGKSGANRIMKRWHFNNCKERNDN
jgi:ribosomal protein L37AE/L43A